MDQDFLTSRISDRPRILGLKLHPLSLGHRLLLERAASPYCTGAEPTPIDTILAVLICSMRFEDCLIAFDSPRFGKQIKKWVRQLRKVDFILKTWEFKRYWFNGNKIPDYRIADDELTSEWSGTPWPQRLKIFLMTHLHFSEAEVLDRPIRICWWDMLCFEEMRGRVTMISEDVRSIEDTLQAQADAVAAGLKGTQCQPNQS